MDEEKQKKEYSISKSIDKPELQLGRQITFVMPFKLIKEPTITVAITAAVSYRSESTCDGGVHERGKGRKQEDNEAEKIAAPSLEQLKYNQ